MSVGDSSMIPVTLAAQRVVGALAVLFLSMLQLSEGASEEATNNFLRASSMQKEDVFAELNKEMNTQFHEERIEQLETLLRPMYASLPKLADGTLGHTVVRYALHRLLAKAHGWFVIGLEPERDGTNMSVTSLKTQMEWVPTYLQDVLENTHPGRGVSMHEVAVLAMTLEDLARNEAVGRLEAIYDIYGIDNAQQTLSDENVSLIRESAALVYLKGGNRTAKTDEEARRRLKNFKHHHKQTPRLQQWLSNLSAIALNDVGAQNFDMTARVFEDIGKNFGNYNTGDCAGVKDSLVSIEDRMPGRVLLSDFYEKGLHGQWKFTEKVEYLRDLGALDEADPQKPRVIVPNYVGSRPQCLAASGVYAICCPNECEALMEQLEVSTADSDASPNRVRGLVENLSSPTVMGPRALSPSLISRLESVADANGGLIPLHGRLFAQWMHNVFPRECPFPHATGSTSPQTPDEWMRSTGHTSTEASEEEMVCHVSGPCAGGLEHSSMIQSSVQEESHDEGPAMDNIPWDHEEKLEIPWDHAEELLDGQFRPSIGRAFTDSGAASPNEEHRSFKNVLRTFAIAGTAIGIALWLKRPLSEACGEFTNKFSLRKALTATRMFFLAPDSSRSSDCSYWKEKFAV